MLRSPGTLVPPNLGPETMSMARDLVRRGMDASALEVFRFVHNVAWQRWTEIVFQLTSDLDELRQLLDLAFRAASDFVDETVAGLTTQMQLEYAELTQHKTARRLKLIELILNGADIDPEQAEQQLGLSFDGSHTAVIIWSEAPDEDPTRLEQIVESFKQAIACTRALTVIASASTGWVWVNDVALIGPDQLRDVVKYSPDVRIAIGSTATGFGGFSCSHRDAMATQRTLIRLRSRQQIAFFADVQLVALLTENGDGADEFIRATLGDFESADPTLHKTLLAYINAECNASRAAKRLYTRRNTLLHRLDAAQKLLPRDLDNKLVEVAVAIKVALWRAPQSTDSAEIPADQYGIGSLAPTADS
jgi:DNA-binding PucR family transcriptional regulator